METIADHTCFAGTQSVLKHTSSTLACDMEFALYTPPQAVRGPRPLVVWLSGLTCTWENATTKAGFQRIAAELGLFILAPDTSPRGSGVPDTPEEYDFGSGAGFYLDATETPWSANYRMARYVVDELVPLVCDSAPIDKARIGISGHSMGGHGALTLHLKNPDLFRTVSAFAPIVSPSTVPFGRKAFGRYLGADEATWAQYDACRLVAERQTGAHILIDQGGDDEFLAENLKPELFEAACEKAGQPLTLRLQDGYNHSYYFVSSFMEDHLRHHAKGLGA
jgi:S-formylglutathione hydrolase